MVVPQQEWPGRLPIDRYGACALPVGRMAAGLVDRSASCRGSPAAAVLQAVPVLELRLVEPVVAGRPRSPAKMERYVARAAAGVAAPPGVLSFPRSAARWPGGDCRCLLYTSGIAAGHGQFLHVVAAPGDRHFNGDLWQIHFGEPGFSVGAQIEMCIRDRKEVVQEVRDTVVHEIGHHFGLDDDEMPY